MPETLETIAASLRDLRKSMDSRFDDVKSQLRTEIESVRGDVRLVAEALAAQTAHWQRHEDAHTKLDKQRDSHDLRILALEGKTSGSSESSA